MQCGRADVTFHDSRKTLAWVGLLSISPRAVLPAALPEGARCGMSTAPDILGEPLAITEVARLLGCSVWTVRQRYLPSGLPYFRIGKTGKITFYRNQVVRWILKNQIAERR
jgi:hypothetical protein